MKEVHVYVSGLCFCSVCAPKDMHIEDVEAATNHQNPSGVTPWRKSPDDFKDGEPNPGPCEDDGSRVHYLMVC